MKMKKAGGIKTAAFAPAKAAPRSLTESMAKHLWSYGIHVPRVIEWQNSILGMNHSRL